MNDLGGLLSSIFTGAIGLNQLAGGGGSSVSGSAAAGAAAADPFASQRQQYQQQLAGMFGGMQGQIGQAQGAINPIIGQLQGLGGNATMQSLQGLFNQPQQMLGGLVNSVVPGVGTLQGQINDLASNYMNNPAIRAQYNLGLESVNRGLSAQGLMGSGQQMAELERYGQQFASNAYQQQFQNLLQGTQAQAGLAGQQFSQQAIAQQLQNQMQQQRFGQGLSLQQMLSQSLGQAGQLQLGASGQALGASGNLLQQLLTASGATTGSPGTAGGILSGQFANSQQAAANLGQGVTGALSRLLGGGQGGSGLPTDSIRKLIDMFGGGGNFAPALASGLGELFGGGGIFGGSFAGGAGFGIGDTLGSMFGTGSYLPGIGGAFGTTTDLGGALLGFSEGTSAAAGAGSAGATGAASGAGGAGFGGLAAMTAAPFAIAIGGMLGGLLGYSDDGTPQTNLQGLWASALSSHPELLRQYGSMENYLASQGIYAQLGTGYSWDQYNQALAALGKSAPMGSGWWLGGNLMDNGGG